MLPLSSVMTRATRRPRKTKPAKSKKARKAASSNKSSRSAAYGRRIQFAEMKGRTVETIEFYTSPDYHSISVNFDDKTTLSLDIDPVPGFTVSPIYQRWKAGNSRVLRGWPKITSL